MQDADLRRARRFFTFTFFKIFGALALAFYLARFAVPELINAQDDTLVMLGLLCAVCIPVVLGWAAVSIYISTRRFLAETPEK